MKKIARIYNRHEIVSLDVLGNAKDGFELNAMYNTGNFVDVPIDATDSQALMMIRHALWQRGLTRGYRNESTSYDYYFVRNDTGKPSYSTIWQGQVEK